MLKLSSTIKEFIDHPKLSGLKPHTKIAYLYLLDKAGEERVIKKFSVRKQAEEWKDNPELKLTGNKDMVGILIKELEEAHLVRADYILKTLTIR